MEIDEVAEIMAKLNKLRELIKTAFDQRPPLLNGERYLTSAEICALLHVSLRTLQNFRDTGILPFIHLAGKTLYKESDVHKLLEDNYIKNIFQ